MRLFIEIDPAHERKLQERALEAGSETRLRDIAQQLIYDALDKAEVAEEVAA